MNTNKDFIERNIKLIHYLADRIGKHLSKEDREDLVQEVSLKILKSEVVGDQDHASALFSSTMKSVLINTVRNRGRDAIGHCDSLDQPVYDDDGETITLIDTVPSPDINEDGEAVDVIHSLYKNDIENLCRYLSKQEALVFSMRYKDYLPPSTIAKRLQLTEDSVRSALKRAVKNARNLTTAIPSIKSKYNGLSLQEMALAILPDRILYPFKLRHLSEKSLLNIALLTGRNIDDIKNSISTGEIMIRTRYGIDVQRR